MVAYIPMYIYCLFLWLHEKYGSIIYKEINILNPHILLLGGKNFFSSSSA